MKYFRSFHLLSGVRSRHYGWRLQIPKFPIFMVQMKSFSILSILLFSWAATIAQSDSRSLPERLGYPAGTKLLIIHADDLGVAHAEDEASELAFAKGSVRSGSIMVPCPWFLEMAEYARSHPEADLGIHCTLTSEWKSYKWGPVAGKDKVPSLVNRLGYFYSSADSLARYATLPDLETEIRAQIEKALAAGIHPTHLDAHMGCLFLKPDYIRLLLHLGHEYHIPVLLNRDAFRFVFQVDIQPLLGPDDIVTDQLFMAQPSDYAGGMEKYYRNLFASLKPGLNCLLLHAAFNNDEMKAITEDHPDYGAAWRQADFDFFTSEACRQLLAREKIRVVTWREVWEKWNKGKP